MRALLKLESLPEVGVEALDDDTIDLGGYDTPHVASTIVHNSRLSLGQA